MATAYFTGMQQYYENVLNTHIGRRTWKRLQRAVFVLSQQRSSVGKPCFHMFKWRVHCALTSHHVLRSGCGGMTVLDGVVERALTTLLSGEMILKAPCAHIRDPDTERTVCRCRRVRCPTSSCHNESVI
jgi:hypothetical protein